MPPFDMDSQPVLRIDERARAAAALEIVKSTRPAEMPERLAALPDDIRGLVEALHARRRQVRR